MNKGTKTTIVGALLALMIIAVIALKYFGKLGEGLSEVFIAITGLLTALGLFYAKDSDKTHTQDRSTDQPNPNHEEK